MIWHIRLHRADHADVINAFGDMRKQLADVNSAFPMRSKFERRGKGRARLSLGLSLWRSQLLFLPSLALKRKDVAKHLPRHQLRQCFRRQFRHYPAFAGGRAVHGQLL